MTKKAAPLGHIRHLLHKATLPSGGNRAALPNTQKQTQGHSQNEETKKQRKKKKERTGEIFRKRTKRNGDKLINRYGVQNNGYKDAQTTSAA